METLAQCLDQSGPERIHLKIESARFTHGNVSQVKALLEHHRSLLPRPVHLDLGEVRHVDSSAVGLLLHLKQQSLSSGLPFTVSGIQGPLEEIFEKMHLLRWFRPEPKA